MKVHVLQHASYEGLGNMEPWLRERGARVSFSRLHESPALPDPAALRDVDLLIALGGPMSANDEDVFPWLKQEKRLVDAAIESGIAVLGVCLGAQLIAVVAGARVYVADEEERGWHAVSSTSPPESVLHLPNTADVFHWHRETFDLPADSVNLARSAVSENQAFQLGARVIGLQFHLEKTRGSVAGVLEHCAADLVPGRYVQSERQIRAAPERSYVVLETLTRGVLDYLIG